MHSMTCRTEGIQSTAPVRWRSFESMCTVYWEAQGRAGATGYYRSPDPRVMLFFNDVSDSILFAGQNGAPRTEWRPMLRALYVPSGLPMWTSFRTPHRFSHLDLHIDAHWLRERIAPMLGDETARAALRQPAEVQDVGALAALAQTLADEIDRPSRAPAFAESLAVALVTGLVAPKPDADETAGAQGGLSAWQMRRLRGFLAKRGGRASNAELAREVGLSEGWFSHAFKRTTGKTPLQWQQEQRISAVKECLLHEDLTIAEIALRFEFSDQGHLTRVFRRHAGITPSAWRREARAR
ncbi:helix-turn-helix domain-containing protein [Alloyangia pacifica]|uniref:helix-turn-helix domain-containing protein n=1 Tax=Alloyangia pacifica TaxID=311180 RepID=UPI001CFCA2A7|nr:AraC family transcriptional regulator [Alloyangia pacifica]